MFGFLSTGTRSLFSLVFGKNWGREGTHLGPWRLVWGDKHTQGCVGDGGRRCVVTLSADWCWWREEWSCLGPDAGYDHWGCLRHCSGPLVTSRTAASLRPTHRGLPTPPHNTYRNIVCAANRLPLHCNPTETSCIKKCLLDMYDTAAWCTPASVRLCYWEAILSVRIWKILMADDNKQYVVSCRIYQL